MPKYNCSTREGHTPHTVEADTKELAAVKYKSLVGLDGIGMPIDMQEVADSNPKHGAKNKRTVKDETTVTPEQTEGIALTGEETSDLDEFTTDKPTERSNVAGTKALTTREHAEQARADKAKAKKGGASKGKAKGKK